jgi:hypothetical protein
MSDSYTSTLMLSFVQSLGEDPSQPAGPGSEAYEIYYRLANDIQRWRTSIDKESVRREYNLLKANWSHRKGLIDATVKLAGIDQKDRASYMSAVSRVETAVMNNYGKIASMKSTLNTKTMAQVDQATTGLSGKSKAETGWRTLLGGLAQDDALGRTSDVLLPGLIANMEAQGYSISDIDKGTDLHRRVEAVLKRSKNAEGSSDAYEKKLTDGMNSIKDLKSQIEALKPGEDPTSLLAKLHDEAESFQTVVTGATGALPGSVVSARLKEIDGERKTLETMEARFESLDQQLFAGGGVDSERQRFAQVVGRDNFKEWALDNGYSPEDIGMVQFDESGRPIMSTYIQGRHTAKAIKHFEWQLQNPKKQSRLFGKGPGTNEVISFMMKTDAAEAERLKHTDGKWYTQEGPNGTQDYVTAAQIEENKAYYSEPTVFQQGRIVKAGGAYYSVDPKTNGFTLLDKKPEKWDDAKSVAMVFGQGGKASRYLTQDDITSGTVQISGEGRNVSTVNKVSEAGMAEIAEDAVTYQAHESPPPGARQRISVLRQRTHAWDVAGPDKTRIRGRDVNTGLIVTYRPEDITDVQIRKTKPTTDLKDFVGKIFYAPKVRAEVDKVEGADPNTVQTRTMFGIEVEDHGDTGVNVLDQMMYPGGMPDMSKAEKEAVEQETLVGQLAPGLQLAQEASDTANAKYQAAVVRDQEANRELQRLLNQEPQDDAAILAAQAERNQAFADRNITRRDRQNAFAALNKFKSDLDPLGEVEASIPDDALPEDGEPVEMTDPERGVPAVTGPDTTGKEGERAAAIRGEAKRAGRDASIAAKRKEFEDLLASDQLTDEQYSRASDLLAMSEGVFEEEEVPALVNQLKEKHLPALMAETKARAEAKQTKTEQEAAAAKDVKRESVRRGLTAQMGATIEKAEEAEKRMAEIQSTVGPMVSNPMATKAELDKAKTLIVEYENLAKYLNLEGMAQQRGASREGPTGQEFLTWEETTEDVAAQLRSEIDKRESEFAKRHKMREALAKKASAVAAMQEGQPTAEEANIEGVPGADPALLEQLKKEREAQGKSRTVDKPDTSKFDVDEDPMEPGDIEFGGSGPIDIKTGGAFLQGEEEESPVRLAEASGQPGARSPTATGKPPSGAGMVPAVKDKDRANAQNLLRVQREMREVLGLSEGTVV